MTTFPVPPPATVKLLELFPVPPAVVTLIVPVVAPVGTVAVICVSEFTVKDEALVPLNVTEVAPVKFAPVIVTLVPTAPLVGEKLVILGTGVPPVTVKLPELVAMPPSVVMLIVPVVAPVGTVAVTCVSEFTVKDEASVPLNLTNEAPVKLLPVMT